MGKRLLTRLLWLVERLGYWTFAAPQGSYGTGGYGRIIAGGITLLYLVGLAVAWPVRGGGLAIMVVAAVAMVQLFVLQYGPVILPRGGRSSQQRVLPRAVWLGIVAVALAVPIAMVWRRWPEGDETAGDLTVLGAVLGVLVVLPLLRFGFVQVFGPHHPESVLPVRSGGQAAAWYWVGGVTDREATVVVRAAPRIDASGIRLRYRLDEDGAAVEIAESPVDDARFARFHLAGLAPRRTYRLTIEVLPPPADAHDAPRAGHGEVRGRFRTFPAAGERANVRLAFASCASTGSNGAVFDTIRESEPDVFVVTGDLHYENITVNSPARFFDAFDRVHSSPAQRRLYERLPIAYVWDDHDSGPNDSDHSAPSRCAARWAYRVAVPSYLDPDHREPAPVFTKQAHDDRRRCVDAAINQEFTIGRVRVVMTDNRTERNEEQDSLFGAEQEAWVCERINDRSGIDLVIWVSSTPWISDQEDSDNWGAYAMQRRRIADRIAPVMDHLVSVSGDAHMVAIDDGTNSNYTTRDDGTAASPGFPVLNAASLDRRGSLKGGTFSEGSFPGAGQFGLVDVTDEGDSIRVRLSGRLWTGQEIVSHEFRVPVTAG